MPTCATFILTEVIHTLTEICPKAFALDEGGGANKGFQHTSLRCAGTVLGMHCPWRKNEEAQITAFWFGPCMHKIAGICSILTPRAHWQHRALSVLAGAGSNFPLACTKPPGNCSMSTHAHQNLPGD